MPTTGSLGLRNPILPGFNPDPSLIRIGNDYFLCTSTFEYFPGLPIYHSTNLVNWKLVGHVLTRRSQLDLRECKPGGGIFAPTIRHHQGRFYATVSVTHRGGEYKDPETSVVARGFHVWTDNIWDSDSWSEPIYHDVSGIDQDLFWDEVTGKTWLSLAKPFSKRPEDHTGFPVGVYTCEIDIESGRQLTPTRLIKYGNLGNGITEGPHIFKRGQYYYLITAEGGTEIEHQEWVCRSTAGPEGPWEVGPSGTVNPIIYNGDHPEIKQTGHMDMIEGVGGQWWAVFLAVRPVFTESGEERLSHLGRETFLAPVEWHDGWPRVNDGKTITINAGVSSMPDLPRSTTNISPDLSFSSGQDLFKNGWYRLRTPVIQDHSLTDRPGSLALRGGPYGLNDNEAVAMFLQKQTAFTGQWEVTIDYQSPQEAHEAGTAVWWSKYAYASLGIRGGEGGQRYIVFRSPDPDPDSAEANKFLEKKIVAESGRKYVFRIEADPLRYRFGYKTIENPAFTHIGELPTALLVRTRPFDSIFTGTHLAIYAAGAHSESSLQPTYFSSPSWRATREGGD